MDLARSPVTPLSHSDVDGRLGESFDGFVEAGELLFQLLLVSLHFCRVCHHGQPLQLLVRLLFGLSQIAESFLAFIFGHEARARRVL